MSKQTVRRFVILGVLLFWGCGLSGQETAGLALSSLLPRLPGWSLIEQPRSFSPGTLFEYIDGAAENYLSYGFRELLVGDLKKDGQAASLTVEIYDMEDETRAFGVYSSERYPESRFLDIGSQGYIEEGTLNFIVGGYYVKLLCYDCGDRSDQWLREFSDAIVKRVQNEEGFPTPLKAFPQKGALPNTEKFILKNVMGYKFLHDGYIVSYKIKDVAFDCFLIEGENTQEAKDMLTKYLDAKGADSVQKTSSGFRIKDRYYQNIFVAQVNNTLCGVMKIPDGMLEIGESYLQEFVQSVKDGI